MTTTDPLREPTGPHVTPAQRFGLAPPEPAEPPEPPPAEPAPGHIPAGTRGTTPSRDWLRDVTRRVRRYR